MSGKSREEILAEYEKDYLERLSKKGEDSKDVESISEEERTQKIQAAEKLQNESAAQIQAAQKKKDEFDKEVLSLKAELRLLKEMATLTEELESLKKEIKRPSRRKPTRKKAAPKRKTTKRKVRKKKTGRR